MPHGVLAVWRETYLGGATWRLVSLVMLVVFSAVSVAAGEGDSVDTLLRGLKNPCGVAIRPGGSAVGFEVFVSDTGGGRIVKIAGQKPSSPTEVVTGFATTGSGPGPLETSGPRGLLFLGRSRLLVVGGGGGQKESLRLYELPDDGPLKAGDAKTDVSLPAPSDGERGVARLYGLARTQINAHVPDEIVVTTLGGDARGGLSKATVQSGIKLGELTPFATGPRQSPALMPVGIVVSGKGYVVVGQTGSRDKPSESALVFYSPIDGASLLKLPTTLHDISGLAYSEETQNLFACDLAVADPKQGGVFRIDDVSKPGEPACKAVRIATIERPTALAFGPDGALYVTACGSRDGQGVLVRITSPGKAL